MHTLSHHSLDLFHTCNSKFFDTENNLLYESPPSKYKKGRWAPNWFAKIVEPKLTDFRLNIPQGSKRV